MNETRPPRPARTLGRALMLAGLLTWTPTAVLLSQEEASSGQESPEEGRSQAADDDQAADVEASAVDEEITVTARKREEVLREVPIAITLVTGEQLQQTNTPDLSSLSLLTTNFTHSEDVNSFDRFIVRGLGTTGSNLGFEEAVGQVINGYFFGRSRFGRTMFLDVDQVEILKGPQGALIGKNNSVGAINITTRKPGADFGGYLNANYDFAAGEGYSLESAFDTPISDAVKARLAGRLEDREGWLTNLATGTDEQERDDVTGRGLLDWQISDSLQAELMLQAGDLQRDGRAREIYNCRGDALSPDPLDPGEDCLFNAEKDVVFLIDTSGSIPQVWVNNITAGVRSALGSLNKGDRFNIVFFSDQPKFFNPDKIEDATPENLARAQQFLVDAKSKGYTDVNRAIGQLLTRDLAHQRAYVLVLISDGKPTRGVTDTRDLINLITRDNDLAAGIYCVGITPQMNRELLNFLAYRNKGFSVFAKEPRQVGAGIRNLLSRIRYPLIKDVSLNVVGLPIHEVFPHHTTNIHQGERFSIFGRYPAARPSEFTMRLSGHNGVKQMDFTFSGDLRTARTGDQDIPETWGFWKLHHLYSEIIRQGETKALKDAINDLKQRFKLKTLY